MMKNNLVSNAFMTFMEEAPKQAEAWGKLAMDLNQANSLDNKTATLVYIGIMAAKNILSGIPFHVLSAKEAGATRDEVTSAILMGLPLAGSKVTQALPLALQPFDEN
ncbi:MAG: carboxymuconolactone decarboxylase family protein [Chloroflexi bacterium]|nr:carboxymuconolactone decarboxylase family protein [Chloroflexota bacterium]MBT4003720.1 carboxymuconolactone decarboxylase family protein [Chloroflexota bacterium]MBT4304437.1 carboxymuconolactone decarboxylase family protein [Chloroflexota bacterium]MBT4534905.1 carboxymuconolactone decarboxylase family protein [Chloroflexota bacterium]MBT4684216.1 carboxymuconolactone decarboxylase family protein [Chloroflexota bacterium]